ncbi:hypothetical protein KX928_14050 [Roseobacter sp. YSTF-M11]|uniref:Uncharacterized protein n=1 Tax=Roseobacter insulae TaxID=2859783 RepID=A0A9X1FWG7_9RHOB|nr:hypothetical protein [Roseobacter insulae]MBW4708907.1 hypothetical protein [Roseobacter insulae]
MKTKTDAAPLFSLGGVFVAFCVAVLLCWPNFVTGGIFTFSDTSSYIRGGERIWGVLTDALMPAEKTVVSGGQTPQAAPSSLSVDAKGGSTVGRSFVYSLFSYVLLKLSGPTGIALAQGTIIVVTFLALVDRAALQSRRIMLAGAGVVVVLTTLPWHAVYLMPDVFGSVIIIFGAILVSTFNDLSTLQKTGLTVLAAAATATHYGNVPLMAGVGFSGLFWLLLTRRLRLSAVIAVVCAVSFSPVVNVAASSMFLKTPSAAPMRLPILLARSLADGPANWYLEAECETSHFAMCEAFGDNVPDSIRDLLWAKDGVQSLSPELVSRIRAEEFELLQQVFLRYPVEQTASLSRNTLKQLVTFGTGLVFSSDGLDARFRPIKPSDPFGNDLRRAAEPVVIFVAGTSFLALLALALTGKLTRSQRRMFVAICYGLFFNAAVFGGLSAPVDRYQARIMWIVPAFLVVVIAHLNTARRDQSA